MFKSYDSQFRRSKRGKENMKITYLIFCEGETEKLYFQDIRRNVTNTITIECKQLHYKNFEGSAKEMVNDKNKRLKKGERYDYSFCIFDNNNLAYADFQKGVKKMKELDIELIYSNKSFEVWILMHFDEFNKKVLDQDDYQKEIAKYLPNISKPYPGLFSLTNDKIQDAINNAKKISNSLLSENSGERYKCEPYTDMRIILENLLTHFKK